MTNACNYFRTSLLLCALVIATPSLQATAQRAPSASVHPVSAGGQHDFDFEIGTWKINARSLLHPLTGSHIWVTHPGRLHLVRKVWGGRASLAELEETIPSRHFDGLMLRLYDPQSHRWRVYWGSSATGTLDTPLIGRFENGRGEFFGHDVLGGKRIEVRVVYSDITPTSFRTEQSFSPDGRTWEVNSIQRFRRLTK